MLVLRVGAVRSKGGFIADVGDIGFHQGLPNDFRGFFKAFVFHAEGCCPYKGGDSVRMTLAIFWGSRLVKGSWLLSTLSRDFSLNSLGSSRLIGTESA